MSVRIAIAVVVAMCTSQVAIAADIIVGPPPTFYDWSGVYVGANLGYAISGSISDTAPGASTPTTQSISGAIAGGQLGVNFQFLNLVLGIEADADWSNQGTASGTSPAVNVPWLATARVRIGYAIDRLVMYATGGAGYVQLKSTAADAIASTTSTHTAWVVGIGQESAVTRNVLFRLEVLYLQLLGTTQTPAGATPMASTQTGYDIIARVGLSYKFDWP
jgi:outer membrane immunogenic protein